MAKNVVNQYSEDVENIKDVADKTQIFTQILTTLDAHIASGHACPLKTWHFVTLNGDLQTEMCCR